MTKSGLISVCEVPNWMANDPKEPVTQEKYTEGLTNAVKILALTISELEDIRDQKLAKGELKALINTGLHS